MSAARRRILTSRIYRRVQAHAGVAVLFRTGAQAKAPVQARVVEPERTTKTAVAFPIPPDAPLPLGRVISGVPLEPQPPAVFLPETPAPVESPILPPAPRLTPQEPPPVMAAPAPVKEVSSLDAEWPRLKTILQRHKEAEAAGLEPERPPAKKARPASKTQRAPAAARPVKLAAPKPGSEEVKEIQTKPVESPAPLPPARQPAEQMKTPKPRLIERARKAAPAQRAMVPAQPPPVKTEIQPASAVDETARALKKEDIKPAAAPPPQKAQRAVKPSRGEPVPPSREEQKPAPRAPVQPARPEPAGVKPPVEKPPAARKSEPRPVGQPEPLHEPPPESAEEQPLPLEAAWPVIQREPEATVPVKAAVPPEEKAPTPPPELPSAEKKRLKKVETLLQKVEAEKPSDSRVEIIIPRRPRPPALIQKKQEEVEESVEETKPAAPPVKKKKASPAPAPEMVETEIGPLPGDLWQLIGQPVPQPQAAKPVEAAPPESEKPAPSEAYLWPEEEVTPEKEEPGEIQLQAENAPASGGAIGAPGEAGGETSIDDLARQVYREIKRRFAIELERFRRRK